VALAVGRPPLLEAVLSKVTRSTDLAAAESSANLMPVRKPRPLTTAPSWMPFR
jgi:hypothetical protein